MKNKPTTTIQARQLRAGDVIVGGAEVLRVTSDARRLGVTGLVRFGVSQDGRDPWGARLPADQSVQVEPR